MLGIIGGSGLDQLPNLTVLERHAMATPYGDLSSPIMLGAFGGRTVAFVARHGERHTIPPHRVNYRANMWALHSVGVDEVCAVFAVGGIGDALGPGVLVVPDQLIDYTWGRAHTYSDDIDRPVVHIDFTHPYAQPVRNALLSAAEAAEIDVVARGVYAAVNGPRLETAAEINRLEQDGATIVGMTGMPEAALARELGIRYAALAVSVNFAAGRGPGGSTGSVALADIPDVLARSMISVCAIIEHWVRLHD